MSKKRARKPAPAGEKAKTAKTKTVETRTGTYPAKVRATAPGYYGEARRREGDVFTIEKPEDFSSKWMERVSKNTPEKTTTGQQIIDQKSEEAVREQMAAKGATGGQNPLGAE